MSLLVRAFALLALSAPLACLAACSSHDDGGGTQDDAGAGDASAPDAADASHPDTSAPPHDASSAVDAPWHDPNDGSFNPDALPQENAPILPPLPR